MLFLHNKKHHNDHCKHQRDPRGGIEEETFRNDVDEHVGTWIEDPQIIVEKDFVENNEIFWKVCGYNADQGQCYGKDRAGADTEGFRDQAL